MQLTTNVVTIIDTRSKGAGTPDKCFYCKGETGGPHDAECVCIDRPIKIRMTIEIIVPIARSWSQDQIEFYFNDSSSCLDNLIPAIERMSGNNEGHGSCLCSVAEVTYLGEATIEEAAAIGLVDDLEKD